MNNNIDDIIYITAADMLDDYASSLRHEAAALLRLTSDRAAAFAERSLVQAEAASGMAETLRGLCGAASTASEEGRHG